MRHHVALFLAATLLTSAGCSVSGPGNVAMARSDASRAAADPAAAGAAGKAIDAFGFDLFRSVAAGDPTADLVISPASIAIALAMARAGAHGETADQMDAVLRALGSDGGAAGINALDQALAARSGSFKGRDNASHDLALRIANAPFAQRDTVFQPAFLDALASRFGAGVRLVDYKSDAEGARRQINGWVNDATEKRIPELLTPGILDALTRLVLVNAIYLKAPWETPFSPEATEAAPFTRLDGSSVDVPTMFLQESFEYAEGPGWRAVELPYVGGSLAMTIIVPDDMAAYEQQLDTDSFAALTAALGPHEVDLTLPRFEIETKADLAALLGELGMPLAFDPDRADFSGITAQEQLFIAHVVHQANISVDEKGTEAAAATGVVMSTTAMPAEIVRMHIDRPFLFALRDLPTEAILFLGRVLDPANPS
jgi:serine protease inhibitor